MRYIIYPVFSSKHFVSYRSSSLYASVTARTLTPARSIPYCSHHILAIQAPGFRTIFLQRSRIGRVAMYCTTMFCFFNI